MLSKNIPIKRRLITMILLTSGLVLFVTCTAFFVYEFVSFRQTTERQLATLGEIIAANSTAALAFDSPEDAHEILNALKAEKNIVAACLYDKSGKIFSKYPVETPDHALPKTPGVSGYVFSNFFLTGFQPVIQGTSRLGTLYLKSDLKEIYGRVWLYAWIVLLVIVVSFAGAYLLSNMLQKNISNPILALAQTAKAVSERHDYSVRALKQGDDEVGLLTEAFNQMLIQIEVQNFALSRSKERMENIVESMWDAYVSLDRQWKYTFLNKKALDLIGKNKEDLLGKTLWEIFPDVLGTTYEREYIKVMSERTPYSFEMYYPSYDMWLEIRAYPNEDGVAIFYNDITKYRKAEEEIRAFNQKLEEKVEERTKELESFSYSISHDLRAPLRSLDGYSRLLYEDYYDKIDEDGRKSLDRIMHNAKMMGRLIDDLLDFSKIGRKELTKNHVDMKHLVDYVIAELSDQFEHRNIVLKVLPLEPCLCDMNLMKQVWVNLISNAIKYSRNNVEAVIEIDSQVKEGQMLYSISDNGAGFDMQYVDKLFGVFQRLHKEKDFEGTGVGLAIVQRIIVKHGGKIWAEGAIGKGAKFYFTIPMG